MATMTIIYGAQQTTHEILTHIRLSDVLQLHEAPLAMPCAGRGTCKKCRVRVAGKLSPLTAVEHQALTEAEIQAGVRLACQAVALGDCTVWLTEAAGTRIETEGALPSFDLMPWGEGLGTAVDIGTTTVAAYLYDLATGERIALASRPNPQATYGADVLSRLDKATKGEGGALRQVISDGIAQLFAELCQKSGRTKAQITCAVLTGNTAMLYLLCGYAPQSIMFVPFEMDRAFGDLIDPLPFGLPASAKVYLPRCISAYVGADITTALLASSLFANGQVYGGKPTLLVDIGTNGEMVLCAGGRLLACSTAAGPAFEGAGIYQGMPAQEGAIAHVRWEGDRMHYEILGDVARGLCGSGIVDAVAAMLDAGVIDETGMLMEEDHSLVDYIEDIHDQPALRLPGTDVFVTQADVRAVQLAKAAIHAGMVTLLHEAHTAPVSIDRLLIAGGFGSHISPRAAERIGLIPPGFAAKAQPIGNAAGMGAAMALLSSAARQDGETLTHICDTIALATNPTFMDQYIEQMMFE